MNMPEGTLETNENVRDPSKNINKQDDKKLSPIEKTDQVTSNDQLNAYEDSDETKIQRRQKNSKRIPGECEKLYIWNSNQMMMWTNKQRILVT